MEAFPVWAIELIKYLGMAGVVFVMWYMQQKMWTSTLERMMVMLRDERTAQLAALDKEREQQRLEMREERNRAFKAQEEEAAREYETVTRIFDSLAQQASISAQMDSKLRSIEKSVDAVQRIVERAT